MKRHPGPEDGGEHYLLGNHAALGFDTERGCDSELLVFKRLAYLIGEYLAKALKIAAKAQTVGLHANIAHLGKVLAYKRGLKVKIMYYHSR